MKAPLSPILAIALIIWLALQPAPARADVFGSGANTFTIPFVPIGNAGNGADTTGFGAVPYDFSISTYAVSQADVDAATALGATNLGGGAWSGDQPAANMNWYQAAAFVNWLNTSQGYAPAYDLSIHLGAWSMTPWTPEQAWQVGGQNLYRNAGAHYFLPSQDEYYKAAYHANDGVTSDYWHYATGSDTAPTAVAGGTDPDTAVYGGVGTEPAAVDNAGGLSPYGTMGQSGNIREWLESAFDGVNNAGSESRTIRGGLWSSTDTPLKSTSRTSSAAGNLQDDIGFRVVSVPEPSSMVLVIGPCFLFLSRGRRTSFVS